MEVMEYLQDNPHIVVNGFKHAGIHQALGILNDDYEELPTYKDDYDYSDDDSFDEYSDEEGPANNVRTPLSVHDVFTDTETEASVLEISSSDESP